MDATEVGMLAAQAPREAELALRQERERLAALAYGPLKDPKSGYLLIGGKSPD